MQASHQALPPARSSFRLSSRSSSCARLTASRSVTVLERAASARSCQSPPPRAARCRSHTGRRVGIAPAASRERRARRPWSQAAAREKPALVRCRARRRQRVRAKAAWTRESNAEPSSWSLALFRPLSFLLQHAVSRSGRTLQGLTVRRDSFHQSLSHIIIYNDQNPGASRLPSRARPPAPARHPARPTPCNHAYSSTAPLVSGDGTCMADARTAAKYIVGNRRLDDGERGF